MRAFGCPACGHRVFFDSTTCLSCGTPLGFDLDARVLVDVRERPRCANAELAACTWVAPEPGALCACCALTRTRPADDDPAGLELFRVAEAAKRRLVLELADLGLPTDGLHFDLLSSAHEPVTTGHASGVVTLDLAESDDARRERRRQQLGEPYRTVLGHLRHEVGHFLFAPLVPEGPERERARALFGDEREDYGAALERHYEEGPPDDWAARHVSAYATMHPAEDWAETLAHVLHLWDVLQTARAFHVRVDAPEPDLATADLRELLATWVPLSIALNALNQSMGRDDLYPFVLADPVVEKLAYAYARVRAASS